MWYWREDTSGPSRGQMSWSPFLISDPCCPLSSCYLLLETCLPSSSAQRLLLLRSVSLTGGHAAVWWLVHLKDQLLLTQMKKIIALKFIAPTLTYSVSHRLSLRSHHSLTLTCLALRISPMDQWIGIIMKDNMDSQVIGLRGTPGGDHKTLQPLLALQCCRRHTWRGLRINLKARISISTVLKEIHFHLQAKGWCPVQVRQLPKVTDTRILKVAAVPWAGYPCSKRPPRTILPNLIQHLFHQTTEAAVTTGSLQWAIMTVTPVILQKTSQMLHQAHTLVEWRA